MTKLSICRMVLITSLLILHTFFMNIKYLLFVLFCSAGLAQTAWAGGATGLVGLLWWEAASVCTAPVHPTPTPMPRSRSPFSPTHYIPIILYPLIIHLHPHCSSPGTLLQGGIDGLSPWSFQSCFGQAVSPRSCPLSTQNPGGGVGLGQGDQSLGVLELVVV